MTEPIPPNSHLLLRVETRAGTLSLHHQDNQLASLPLSLQTIHALYDAVDGQLLTNGIHLDISEKGLMTPLGFEALLQITMMNMVSCVFPQISQWSPIRKKLLAQHPDAEINYIRNAAVINDLNHVHILKNSLAGKPILIALPGPSLDMDYIREHRKSFVLMAAGRGAGKLLNEGIHPDFVYIQDVNTNAWNINFGTLGDEQIPTTLIANPLGRIWEHHHKFKRTFKAWNLYPFEKDGFPKIEEIAPSTVSGAYSMARLLGCNPIVLMGNDCGTNIEPPRASTMPEAMTNLNYTRQDNRLVFPAINVRKGVHMRFGDEISIATQSDYVAGAQWLKIRTTPHITQEHVEIYDQSQTKLCQFHSLIKDASEYTPQEKFELPPLPLYETNYDVKKYLDHKKQSYEFILRQLKNGVIPGSALTKPYCSIFFNSPMGQNDSHEPAKDDFKIGAKTALSFIEHAEAALAEIS